MEPSETLKQYKLFIDENKIEDLKSEEVEVDIVIFSSISSNVYMLNIFATLSQVLNRLSEEGKIKPTIKIEFLIPYDLTNELGILKNPLKDHYGELMTIEDNMMQSIIKIRSFEFKSLANSIMRGLNNLETKDMVLNDVKYHEILGYAKAEAESEFEQRIEQFRKEKMGDGTDPIKQVLFTASTKKDKATKNNKEFHALGELLKIINHYENNEKKIVLIVSTNVKKLIEQFFVKQNTGFINFACYQEPSEVFDKFFSPFSYYTLVSPYINNRGHNKFIENFDELWFAGMLKDLDSSVFVSELISFETICDEGVKFNETVQSKADEEEQLRKVNEGAITLSSGAYEGCGVKITSCTEKIEHYKKNDKAKYQGTMLKAINTGFLTIQEDIVSQLELIL